VLPYVGFFPYIILFAAPVLATILYLLLSRNLTRFSFAEYLHFNVGVVLAVPLSLLATSLIIVAFGLGLY